MSGTRHAHRRDAPPTFTLAAWERASRVPRELLAETLAHLREHRLVEEVAPAVFCLSAQGRAAVEAVEALWEAR